MIARRSGLAVPQLFVFDLGGGELGDAFKAHDDVAKIGDGSVAVLEVKTFEELGGIVRAHPLDGIANGISGTRVSRQRIGDLFRGHGRYGQDAWRFHGE